jgi:hypothetical protein
LTVLGYACRLYEYNLPQPPPDMQGIPATVRQYLLFDPLPESEARQHKLMPILEAGQNYGVD